MSAIKSVKTEPKKKTIDIEKKTNTYRSKDSSDQGVGTICLRDLVVGRDRHGNAERVLVRGRHAVSTRDQIIPAHLLAQPALMVQVSRRQAEQNVVLGVLGRVCPGSERHVEGLTWCECCGGCGDTGNTSAGGRGAEESGGDDGKGSEDFGEHDDDD